MGAKIHGGTIDFSQRRTRILICIVVVLVLIMCLKPMGLAPLWNGEVPGHRDQYEKITDAFLKGQLYFDVEVDPALLALDNPYDREARQLAGIENRQWNDMWDHAYYDGHYYMYFGVVPVLLLFMPYQVLTGEALTTYHATQIFGAFYIAGIFLLFAYLTKKFFPKMPFVVYLLLSAAVVAMSMWYCVTFPALYCTAIMSAMCMMVWSLYFFTRAVFDEEITKKTFIFAALGSLFGALAFGCRPTIALGNLMVIPLLITFIMRRKLTAAQWGYTALCALPYVVVAAGLMWYNNARFDDPFEFGQAYQLTVADQTAYKVTLDKPTLFRLVNNFISNYLWVGKVEEAFPYINTSGVLWNFPVLLLCVALFRAPSVKAMKKDTVLPLAWCLPLTVLVITAMDILWTPYLLERYNMDIYFLLGIALFLAVGYWYATCTEKQGKRLACFVMILSAATAVSSFLYYAHTVGAYYPEEVTAIANAWHLL
jgi:hypothetical protein